MLGVDEGIRTPAPPRGKHAGYMEAAKFCSVRSILGQYRTFLRRQPFRSFLLRASECQKEALHGPNRTASLTWTSAGRRPIAPISAPWLGHGAVRATRFPRRSKRFSKPSVRASVGRRTCGHCPCRRVRARVRGFAGPGRAQACRGVRRRTVSWTASEAPSMPWGALNTAPPPRRLRLWTA